MIKNAFNKRCKAFQTASDKVKLVVQPRNDMFSKRYTRLAVFVRFSVFPPGHRLQAGGCRLSVGTELIHTDGA